MLAVGGWLWWRALQAPVSTTPPVVVDGSTSLPSTPVTPAPTTPTPVDQQLEVETLARLFIERFASFSSDSQFSSVLELEPFTTRTFGDWVETQYLPAQRAKYPVGVYQGQTVKVMSLEVKKLDDTSATVEVQAQLAVTNDKGETTSTYPTATLTFVRDTDRWLVDGAYWE